MAPLKVDRRRERGYFQPDPKTRAISLIVNTTLVVALWEIPSRIGWIWQSICPSKIYSGCTAHLQSLLLLRGEKTTKNNKNHRLMSYLAFGKSFSTRLFQARNGL